MPRYHFNLKGHSGPILDNEGTELPDEVHALRYASEVAKELMFGQAATTCAAPRIAPIGASAAGC
jgi:Domain of unknown function (DUF6894)